MQDSIRFVFDDRIVEVDFSEASGYKPTTTVLNFLRSLPGHKGVKEGCAEGDCGACTVVLAELDNKGKLVYKAVDSCLVFLPMIHGRQLITIENLAYHKENKKILHPVQKSMIAMHGTQCGYCTPGVVMSLFGLFKNHRNPSREVITDALAGNLCRCTGYQSILDAAHHACSSDGKDHFTQYELVVAGLLNDIHQNSRTLEFRKGRQRYFKPFTLADALRLRGEHPNALLINGSTDIALRQTKKKEFLGEIIDLSAVQDLRFVREEGDRYIFGAGLTLEEVKTFSKSRLPALHKILSVFGSLQIRNVATFGGNAGSASPIGDTLPVLFAYKAQVKVASSTRERILPLGAFITGYRTTALEKNELITEIIIPKTEPGTSVIAFKVSRRKEMDISTVSAAFRLELNYGVVKEAIVAFGGMAATTKRATATEQDLTGKRWTLESISSAVAVLDTEFTPISDARADALYRKKAARNLLVKWFLETTSPATVAEAVKLYHGTDPDNATPDFASAMESAEKHVTGESVFVEDMNMSRQLLHGKVVYSKQAHALLRRVDITEAVRVPGVIRILTAADIPGENQMGAVIHDEPCLASTEVTFIGQAVALIAAETADAADEAEQLIKIDYEPLPAILDIQTAMVSGQLIGPARKIERGDPDIALKNAPHCLTGELATGAQEHWYLETQTALAVPGEGNDMVLHASTQNPSETQAIVAEVLGIRKHDVEVEVKRIGGGFGGKETQGNHVAAWSALLANATRRPVKIHLFRDDDQIMTGKRHRFFSTYEIGFDDNGLILAYKVNLNADAGSSTDLSRAILERAMLHADNAYFLPEVSITGRAWKTNLPSNTAFRGFGGPQGMAVIENAIDRIARYLKKDAAEIRYLNFYRAETRNLTPYDEKVENNRLFDMYSQLVSSSKYPERRIAADQFNFENQYFKKGLALTPVKFGISFTTSFLNQAGALVNIYTDGTVLVNHGGTEMGQGLHSKILRIASAELGISPDRVKVNATNTSKVPNTSPTAASSGSDLNGMAVKNAIDTLKERMAGVAVKELAQRYPDCRFSASGIDFCDDHVFDRSEPDKKIPFPDLCNLSRLAQVSLGATGYYKTPGIFFDREAGKGTPFFYYAYGMAVSEVLIDILTGAHRLLRTDILHDAGDSINEGIDIGQVEGGFMQGVGWCTTEEIKWDHAGNLLTHSPDTYKIPSIGDIPSDFRVELMRNVPNPGAIRRSKAVGEPPFMLGLSVWLAIKDAISSIDGHQAEPEFSLPATGEVILNSCENLQDQSANP